MGAGLRGGIIWRLCTQFVVGREGISVNNSDSLHNTGPQENVMYLTYKNRLPPCFCTQLSMAGTQKDCGFVLMTGNHTMLLLNFPALETYLLPLSLSSSWAFSHPTPRARGMPRSPTLIQLTCQASWHAKSFCICPFRTPRYMKTYLCKCLAPK